MGKVYWESEGQLFHTDVMGIWKEVKEEVIEADTITIFKVLIWTGICVGNI